MRHTASGHALACFAAFNNSLARQSSLPQTFCKKSSSFWRLAIRSSRHHGLRFSRTEVMASFVQREYVLLGLLLGRPRQRFELWDLKADEEPRSVPKIWW